MKSSFEHTTILSNTTDCQQFIRFPCTTFPSCFHSVKGIYITFHLQLYVTHSSWINDFLPIIKFLVLSFRLRDIYLFPQCDITNSYPLVWFSSQALFPKLSIYDLLFSSLVLISIIFDPFSTYFNIIYHHSYPSMYLLLYFYHLLPHDYLQFSILISSGNLHLTILLHHFQRYYSTASFTLVSICFRSAR